MATLSESLFPPSNRRRCNKGRPSYVEPSDISVPNEERNVDNSPVDENFMYDNYISNENSVEEDETEVDLCAFMMENPELTEPSLDNPIDTDIDSTHSKFRVTSCELDSTPIVLDSNLALNSELGTTEAVVTTETLPNLNSNLTRLKTHTALDNVVDNLVPGKENLNFVNGQKLNPLIFKDVISKFMKDINKVLFAKKDINFASLELFGKYPLVKCERLDIEKFMKNNNNIKLGNWPYIPPKKSAKFKTTYVNKSNASTKKINVGKMTMVRKPVFKKPKDLKPKIQTKSNFNDFFEFDTKPRGVIIKTNRWKPEITHSISSSNLHFNDSRGPSSILYTDPHRTKSREPSKLIRIFNSNNSDNSLGMPDRKQPFITSVHKVGNKPKTFQVFKPFESNKSTMPSPSILPQSLLSSSQPTIDNFTIISPCDYEVIQPYVEEESTILDSPVEMITRLPEETAKTQSSIVNNFTNSNKTKLFPNYFSHQNTKLSPSNSQNIMLNSKSVSSVPPKICTLNNNENVEDFTKQAVLKAQSTVEDAIKNAVSSGKKKRNSKAYEKRHVPLQSVGSALKESAMLGCQTYNTTLNDILFGCGSVGIDEYVEDDYSEDASASADADAENICSLNSSVEKSFDNPYNELNVTNKKGSYSQSHKKPQRYSKFKKKQNKNMNVVTKIKLEPIVDSDTLSASECGDNSNEAKTKSQLSFRFKNDEVNQAKESMDFKRHDNATPDFTQNRMGLNSYDNNRKRKNKRLKSKFVKRRPKLVLSLKDVPQYQRAKKPVSLLKTKRQKVSFEKKSHIKTEPIYNSFSDNELSSATMQKPTLLKGRASQRTKKRQSVAVTSENNSCLTKGNSGKKLTAKSKFPRRVKGKQNDSVTSEDEALSSREKLILDLRKISGKSVQKKIDNSFKKIFPTDSSNEVLSSPLKSPDSGKCSYKSKRLKPRRREDTISEFKRSTEKFKLKNRPLKVLFKKPTKENKSSIQTTEKYNLLEICKNDKKNNKILNSTFRRKEDTNTPVTNTEEENSTDSKIDDVTSDFNSDMSKDFESLENDSQSSKKEASNNTNEPSLEMSDKLPQNCLIGNSDAGDSINTVKINSDNDKSKNNCVSDVSQATKIADESIQNAITENNDISKSINATLTKDTVEVSKDDAQHEAKTSESNTNNLEYDAKIVNSSSDESSDEKEDETSNSDSSSESKPIEKDIECSESDTSDSDSDDSLKKYSKMVVKKTSEPSASAPESSKSNPKDDSDTNQGEEKSEERLLELKDTVLESNECVSQVEESKSDGRVLQSENNASEPDEYVSDTEDPSKPDVNENALEPVNESEKSNLISEREESESAEDNSELEGDLFDKEDNVLVSEDSISKSRECVSQSEENISKSKESVSETEEPILSQEISESKECVDQTKEDILPEEEFSKSEEIALKEDNDEEIDKSTENVLTVKRNTLVSIEKESSDVSEPEGGVSECGKSPERVSEDEDKNLESVKITPKSKKIPSKPGLKISEEIFKRFRRKTSSVDVHKVVAKEAEKSHSEVLSSSSKNSDTLKIDLDSSSDESNSAEIITTIATVHTFSDSESKSLTRKMKKPCIDTGKESNKKCPKIKISMLKPDGVAEKSDELSNWYVSERKYSSDSVQSDVISEKKVGKETIITSNKRTVSKKAVAEDLNNSVNKDTVIASVSSKDNSQTSQAEIACIKKINQEDVIDVWKDEEPHPSSDTNAAGVKNTKERSKRGRKRKTVAVEDKSPSKSKTQLTHNESKKETPSEQLNEPLTSPNDNKKRRYSLELVTIPFKCGWMREVVHRGIEAKVNGQKADVYYFSPEGVKLRSVPDVTTYLKKLKDCKLTAENFTFAKERIYREPFEVERSAKQKSSFASPALVKKENKNKIQTKLKFGNKDKGQEKAKDANKSKVQEKTKDANKSKVQEKTKDANKDEAPAKIKDANKDKVQEKTKDVHKDNVESTIMVTIEDEVKAKVKNITKSKAHKRKSSESGSRESSVTPEPSKRVSVTNLKKSEKKVESKSNKTVGIPITTPSRPTRNIIKRVPFDNSEVKSAFPPTSAETRSRSRSSTGHRQSTNSSFEDVQKLKQKDTLVDLNADGTSSSTKRTIENETNSDAAIKRPKVKYTPSKANEALMTKPCTFRCPMNKLEYPRITCAICLCMFHKKCLPSFSGISESSGFTFTCKCCLHSQLLRYEISGANNPQFVLSAYSSDDQSPDFPPDFDVALLVPEVILDGVSSSQNSYDETNPRFCSPPPLQKAPEINSSISSVLNDVPCPLLKPAPNFDKSSLKPCNPSTEPQGLFLPSSFSLTASEVPSFSTISKSVRYIPVKLNPKTEASSAGTNLSFPGSQDVVTSSSKKKHYEILELHNNVAVPNPVSNPKKIQQPSQFTLPFGTTLSPHSTTNVYGKYGLSVPPARFQVFRASNPNMQQKVLLLAHVNKVQNRPQLSQSPSDTPIGVRLQTNSASMRPCNSPTSEIYGVPRFQGNQTYTTHQILSQSSSNMSASSYVNTNVTLCQDANCNVGLSDCRICSQSSAVYRKDMATSTSDMTGVKSSWDMSHMIMGYNCLNLIFKWLNIRDLLRASQVCRSWRYLTSQNFLWESVSFGGITITDWERCCKVLKSFRTRTLDFRGIENSISTDDSEKGLLCNLHHLQSVKNIIFGEVSPSVLSVIGIGIPKLLSLECQFLTSTESGENPIFDFAPLRYFEKLCDLKIGSPTSKLVPKNDLVTMPPLGNLKHLSLTAFQFKRPSQFMYLLKDLPQLVNLELGDCDEFTSETYKLLGALTQLKKLRLENGSSTKETGLSKVLERLQSLEKLELMNFKIHDNLSLALNKLHCLSSFNLWPDLRSEEAEVYFNAFNSLSGAKHLKSLSWGIIAEENSISSELTMKNPDRDYVEQMTFETLFDRVVKLLPKTKVEFKCCARSSWNEFCNMRK